MPHRAERMRDKHSKPLGSSSPKMCKTYGPVWCLLISGSEILSNPVRHEERQGAHHQATDLSN